MISQNDKGIDIEELLRRKEVVEWQITICKDGTRLRELEQRLKEINQQIRDLTIKNETL